MARHPRARALALVILALAAGHLWSPPPSLAATRATEVPTWLGPAWSAYKKRFVQAGRVLDDANGISHSEGQGYAMLIAVRAGDRVGFDAIWNWTRRELLIRPDGLAAWRWEERKVPSVTDRNNATDGDVLIVWALAEAAARWEEPAYLAMARPIVSAIARDTVRSSAAGLVFLPGVDGFREGEQPDGPVINLSYWVFPAFDHLKAIDPVTDWTGLEANGLRLIRKGRFGLMRLPADWTAIGSGTPAPAQGFPRRFGYNAIRIPLYLAWAKVGTKADLGIFAGLWNETADVGPFEIDLETGSAVETLGGAGFKAVAALVACALRGRPLPAFLRTVPIEKYYPTTLHILSLLAIQERYPECL